MEALQYPVGKYEHDEAISSAALQNWIDEIAALPDDLARAVNGLNDEQLDTPYRPGGWTVRQVVHHIADSHINSVIRFKWALTEEKPEIKPYYEDRWAELNDYSLFPIEQELDFIRLLHTRWAALLRSLTKKQLQREFIHPESGVTRLDWNIGMYAWHGRHHVAHITSLRDRLGW